MPKTKVTGKIVEIDGGVSAPRSTANVDSTLGVAHLDRKMIFAVNSTNQSCNLVVYGKIKTIGNSYTIHSAPIAAGAVAWISILEPWTDFIIRFTPSVAPTSGNVQAVVIGYSKE